MFQARLLHKIKYIPKAGVQAALNQLASTDEFQNVFVAEVAKRGLRPEDVIPCLKVLYRKVSKHAHGNDGIITLSAENHTDKELAALASILKVQESWSGGLHWRLVKKGKGEADRD